MQTNEKTSITVETALNAPLEKAWEYWNQPEHIMNWNTALDSWHCPRASNDLRAGGRLSSRMEARDGSMGFDFEAVYDEVRPHEFISYTIADGRKVSVEFSREGNTTRVRESFEPEGQNPVEMQRTGWQAILDNFRKYTEEN